MSIFSSYRRVSGFSVVQGAPEASLTAPSHCLYCEALTYRKSGAGLLHKEHVIPQAIGGNVVVPSSSCAACEDAIKRFEPNILKTVLYAPRVHLGLRRKKRKRPEELFELRATVQGAEVVYRLNIRDYPTLLYLPLLTPPGLLGGSPGALYGMWAYPIAPAWGAPALARLSAEGAMSPVLDTLKFTKFLAKIAHGFAIGIVGHDGFVPMLLELIQGRSSDRYLVGGQANVEQPTMALHELDFGYLPTREDGKAYAVVRIRLMSCFGAPTYWVIVGTSSDRVFTQAVHVR